MGALPRKQQQTRCRTRPLIHVIQAAILRCQHRPQTTRTQRRPLSQTTRNLRRLIPQTTRNLRRLRLRRQSEKRLTKLPGARRHSSSSTAQPHLHPHFRTFPCNLLPVRQRKWIRIAWYLRWFPPGHNNNGTRAPGPAPAPGPSPTPAPSSPGLESALAKLLSPACVPLPSTPRPSSPAPGPPGAPAVDATRESIEHNLRQHGSYWFRALIVR